MSETSQQKTDRESVDARRESISLRYFLLINIVTLIVFAVLSLLYTNYVDEKRAQDERDNDREWCDLIVLYDDYFQANPPQGTTEQAQLLKHQAQHMHQRRISLGC